MTSYRGQTPGVFNVGSPPPQINWTIVRGDTAAFRVYVTDENRNPLVISEWTIEMDIYRPSTSTLIVTLTPEATVDDGPGEFTVALTSVQSDLLLTGDIFDIEMTDAQRVWTVAKGTMTVIADITN